MEGLEISKHCVERWRDRFRPALDVNPARRELTEVLASGGWERVDLAPEWCGLAVPDSHTSFLVVGDDLVLVLIELGERVVAKTCVPRGSITPRERMRRRKNKGPRGESPGGRKASRRRRLEPYQRSRMPSLRNGDLLSAGYERMF